MDPKLQSIHDSIEEGQIEEAQGYVQAALDAGVASEVILNDGMIAAMSDVGCLFEEGDYFVPEMLLSARAMQACLGVLKPTLVDSGVEPVGTVVIGTVQGDMHEIGKNLVGMMLEGAGFTVVDLGADVEADKYVAAVEDSNAQIVAMSTLLTTTMPKMKLAIEALRDSDAGAEVKIMVGGAPVTAAYAASIGADGYADDAGQAARLARKLVM